MYRATLTNPDFVKALYQNDILVWGGDVHDLEAWDGTSCQGVTLLPYSFLLQHLKNYKQQHTPLLHSLPCNLVVHLPLHAPPHPPSNPS